jgi:CheY-like chemotaxis protein
MFKEVLAMSVAKNVLIVEDDEPSRSLLNKTLTDLGFETILCTNGKTAFEILLHEAANIDLVVTDIVMPDMDGKEFLHLIRSHELLYDIPVVVISGVVNESELKLLTFNYNPEITFYLAKPLSPSALKAVLHELDLD